MLLGVRCLLGEVVPVSQVRAQLFNTKTQKLQFVGCRKSPCANVKDGGICILFNPHAHKQSKRCTCHHPQRWCQGSLNSNTETQKLSQTDTQKLHSLLAVERALAPMLRIKEYACFLLLTLISTHKDAYSTNLNSGARALSTATQKHRSSGKHRHTGAPVCWLLRAL